MSLIEDIENGVPRQTILTIDGVVYDRGINSGTARLKRNICDNNDFKFGGCIASQFSCILDVTEDLNNKPISVKQRIGTYELPLFKGTLKSCELQADRLSVNITAYDKLNDCFDVDLIDWYNALNFPIQFSNFFKSMLDAVGITYDTSLLIEQEFLMDKVDVTELKFGDLIKQACELCGGFGIINESGNFEIVYLGNNPSNQIYALSGFKLESYTVQPIESVIYNLYEKGTGSNKYVLEDGFFLDSTDDKQIILDNLYLNIVGKSWRVCDFEMPISNPMLELGSMVNVITPQGDDFNTYIMDMKLSGVQLFDEHIASYGNEYLTDNSSSIYDELRALNYKTDKVKVEVTRTVEGLSSTVQKVNKVETDMSRVEQTADKINWLVKSGTSEANMELTDKTYNLVAENITLTGDHIQLDGDTVIGEEFTLTANNIKMGNLTNFSQLTKENRSKLAYRGPSHTQSWSYNSADQYFYMSYYWDFPIGNVVRWGQLVPFEVSFKYSELNSTYFKLKVRYNYKTMQRGTLTRYTGDDLLLQPAIVYAQIPDGKNEPVLYFDLIDKVDLGDYYEATYITHPGTIMSKDFQFYLCARRINTNVNSPFELDVYSLVINEITDGSNIKGLIESVNYEEDSNGKCISGMRTDYTNGEIKSKNFTVNNEGVEIEGYNKNVKVNGTTYTPTNGTIELPDYPSAVTEAIVGGWGFTKNTGTYSKPSSGIPKTDLASAVQTSLNNADNYKGTITGIKYNGESLGTSGAIDLLDGNILGRISTTDINAGATVSITKASGYPYLLVISSTSNTTLAGVWIVRNTSLIQLNKGSNLTVTATASAISVKNAHTSTSTRAYLIRL